MAPLFVASWIASPIALEKVTRSSITQAQLATIAFDSAASIQLPACAASWKQCSAHWRAFAIACGFPTLSQACL